MKTKLMNTPGGEWQPSEENEQSRSSIILENEILLMKLNAEFGARIFLPEQRVEPEIENHFLRSVYDFERNVANGRARETIFRIIGKPSFVEESTLDDTQISIHLDRALDLLYEHRIVLDTMVQYPDRILYRFVTNEFVNMEIDIHGDSECYMHFCYEDFYPNHDYDLRQATNYFVSFIIDDLSFAPQNGLYSRVRTSSGLMIGYKEATRVIRASSAEFSGLKLLSLNISKVTILDKAAVVCFHVRYSGLLRDGGSIDVSGEGRLEFIYSDDYWWISYLTFPGIVI